jgi:hypothetical protein
MTKAIKFFYNINKTFKNCINTPFFHYNFFFKFFPCKLLIYLNNYEIIIENMITISYCQFFHNEVFKMKT